MKILKYLIRRFRVILIVVINSNPKFLVEFKAIAKAIKFKIIIIILYNLKANKVVKASYYIIATLFLKLRDKANR